MVNEAAGGELQLPDPTSEGDAHAEVDVVAAVGSGKAFAAVVLALNFTGIEPAVPARDRRTFSLPVPTSTFLRARLIPLLFLLFLGELVLLLLEGCGGFVVRSDTIVEITFPAFLVRRHGKILSFILPSLFTIKGAAEQSELTV